jgi:2'-5' RNA ligase
MAEPTRRLFFALWPTPAVRRELERVGRLMHEACGGRRMPADDLHITLHFLGATPEDRLESLQALGAAVREGAFALTLAECGVWPRARVGWVAPQQIPPRLTALVLALSKGLDQLRIGHDHHAYRPHVTLLRNPGRPPHRLPAAEVFWPVASFCLVESRPPAAPGGSRYRVLAEWPLQP